MSKITKKEIKNYMYKIMDNHIDPLTGEVNMTTLSESTAYHFDKNEWLDDSLHEVWDCAFEISEYVEKKNINKE